MLFTNTVFFNANAKLIDYAQQAAMQFLANKLKQLRTSNALGSFSIKNPKTYIGKIASGDMFIDNKTKLNAISADMPDLMAVEMDGAAVAQVCTDYDVPFVVIRIISNKANKNAAINFQTFVQDVAKYYTQGIIQYFYEQVRTKIDSASLYDMLNISNRFLAAEAV